MAQITTTTRVISIKESVNEIFDKFSNQWITLTEIIYGEKMNGDTVIYEIEIYINKEFIVEMFD